MSEEVIKKSNKLMYALIKEAARSSFFDFLENSDLTVDDYYEVKKFIEDKTGIEFKYL